MLNAAVVNKQQVHIVLFPAVQVGENWRGSNEVSNEAQMKSLISLSKHLPVITFVVITGKVLLCMGGKRGTFCVTA